MMALSYHHLRNQTSPKATLDVFSLFDHGHLHLEESVKYDGLDGWQSCLPSSTLLLNFLQRRAHYCKKMPCSVWVCVCLPQCVLITPTDHELRTYVSATHEFLLCIRWYKSTECAMPLRAVITMDVKWNGLMTLSRIQNEINAECRK